MQANFLHGTLIAEKKGSRSEPLESRTCLNVESRTKQLFIENIVQQLHPTQDARAATVEELDKSAKRKSRTNNVRA